LRCVLGTGSRTRHQVRGDLDLFAGESRLQPALLVGRIVHTFDSLSAHHRLERLRRGFHRLGNPQQVRGVFFDQLADPLIGKSDVGYLIGNLCFVQVGQLEITVLPRLLDSNRYCIEAAGLEAAVLDREAGGEAVELGTGVELGNRWARVVPAELSTTPKWRQSP